jgi:hypothetical protein
MRKGKKEAYPMNRLRLGVVHLVGLLVTVFFLPLSSASATTPEEYISNGENQLFSETVTGVAAAYATFQTGKTEHPNDPVINAYLALTRLLDLGLREDTGGLAGLLAQFGITRTGDTLETLNVNVPLNHKEKLVLPETAPSGEAIRSFLAGPLLTALNDSISNLDTTIIYWTDAHKHIIPKAALDTDLDIEVDYGDIFLFRAGLKALKALMLFISAYDLNMDPREIASFINLDMFNINNFLDRYQDFLKLLPTTATPSGNGTSQLAQARTALMGAIDDYLTASDKIRNDNNHTAGAEELVEFDPCELQFEEFVRNNLAGLRGSLNLGTPFQFVEREETWVITDGSSGRQLQATLRDNASEGSYYGLNGCDFISCGGWIECVVINGDQITFTLGFVGQYYGEVTFSGTMNAERTQITGGIYSGWTSQENVSGTFTAARTGMTEEVISINLNPLFGNGSGPYNLRDFLPQFNECGGPVPGTVGYGLNPSSPDATLGGVLPDFTQVEWGLESDACPAVSNPTSITGTLNVPNHDGTGPVYIGVFRYNGSYNMDPENRIGGDIIYPVEYTDGMNYTVNNLPTGAKVFVAARWDADFNGVLTPGDYSTFSPVFTTQQAGNTVDLNLTYDHQQYSAPAFRSAGIFGRRFLNGSSDVLLWAFLNGPSPDDVTIKVKGPGGEFELQPNIFFRQTGLNYATVVPFLPNGDYTFEAVDSLGRKAQLIYYYEYNGTLPFVDRNTFSPVNLAYTGTTTPALSWAAPAGSGPYYYQVYVQDSGGMAMWYASPTITSTSVTVPLGLLQPNTEYRWWVRVFDSNSHRMNYTQSNNAQFFTGTKQAPSISEALLATVPPAGQRTGYFNWCGAKIPGLAPWDITSFQVKNSSDAILSQGRLTDPRFYTSAYNQNTFSLANPLPDGDYSIMVADTSGKSATKTISYQYTGIEAVSMGSMSSGNNYYFDTLAPTFSWAPVSNPDTYYSLRVYDPVNGIIVWNSSPSKNTSITVPQGILLPGGTYYWTVYTWDWDSVTSSFNNFNFVNLDGNKVLWRFTISPDAQYQFGLEHVISLLQILAGLDGTGIPSIPISVDVNGDFKTGLAEVIYILQALATLR